MRARKKEQIEAEWIAHAKRNKEQVLEDDQLLSEFSKPLETVQNS